MVQMKLKEFSQEYAVSYPTLIRWIHSKGFPAYKIGHLWYVDIPQYEKWRKKQHQNDYKYAT